MISGDGDNNPPTSFVAAMLFELPPPPAERLAHDSREKHHPPPSTNITHFAGSCGSTYIAGGDPSKHFAPCASASA